MSARRAPLLDPLAASGPDAPPAPRRPIRAACRAAAVLLGTIPALAVQAGMLRLPGRGKRLFPLLYWGSLCRLMGLRVRVIGASARPPDAAPARRQAGRPVVFASNHTSWLDILVLGSTLEACFVAKQEVGTWPLVGTVARLGRTVFVSRRASNTGRERDAMRERLHAGDGLILFPEGTSSDGARVLPFRSVFFSVTEEREGSPRPLVQPVSVVYDQLAGLPMTRASRPLTSWYGDMELAPHFWRLAQYGRLRATVLLHPPLDPADFPSRKALAAAAWQAVADGAAILRQNRPVPAPAALAPVVHARLA